MKSCGRIFAILLALVAADAIGSRLRSAENAELAIAGPNCADAPAIIVLAERGDVLAQARLGWMYWTGRCVPQNYVLAAKWFHCAAEQGHSGAQLALGLLHNKGQGVRRDYVLSYMWMNLSAASSVGEDRDFKARLRNAVATKMTDLQVAKAQDLAIKWYATRAQSPWIAP